MEELEAVKAEKEKILAELRRAQEDIKGLRADNKTLTEKAEANDHEVWKSRALKAEAKLALGDKGIRDPDRILKYMPLDGLDFDENGAVVGLDDRLGEVAKDFPELFDKKRRAGGKGDIFADDAVETKLSSSEIQARQIMGA